MVQVAFRKVGTTVWLAPSVGRRTGSGGIPAGGFGRFAPGAAANSMPGGIDEPPMAPLMPGQSTFTYREKTTEPIRRGIRWRTAERAQYEVRVRRSNDKDEDPEDLDDVSWVTLRTITDEYPIQFAHPLSMTAVAIRATNQLNGVIENLNADCSLLCLDWDTDTQTWIERRTSNPASLYRYVLQSPARNRPIPDYLIDLEALQTWHGFCIDEGFEYNAARDFQSSLYDALSDVAAAGRGSPAYIDGLWSVVVDTGTQTVTQHFSPRNSSAFNAQRHFQDAPDALRVRFANREQGWRRDERVVYNDGYDEANAEKFSVIDAPGVTDPEHVYKMGRFHLAQILLRREVWTFDSDFEYLVARRGDRIKLSHDILLVGLASARIVTVHLDTAQQEVISIEIDERVSLSNGVNYGVSIRTLKDRALSATIDNPAIIWGRDCRDEPHGLHCPHLFRCRPAERGLDHFW